MLDEHFGEVHAGRCSIPRRFEDEGSIQYNKLRISLQYLYLQIYLRYMRIIVFLRILYEIVQGALQDDTADPRHEEAHTCDIFCTARTSLHLIGIEVVSQKEERRSPISDNSANSCTFSASFGQTPLCHPSRHCPKRGLPPARRCQSAAEHIAGTSSNIHCGYR